MDGLLFFGAVVLFFALVVVPIVAITATGVAAWPLQDELTRLRQRLSVLEQRWVNAPVNIDPAPVTAQPLPVSDPVEVVQHSEPVAVSYWGRQVDGPVAVEPAPVALPNVVSPQKETASTGLVSSLARWFMQGNPLAKLGIVLLFIGLSFLLRYTVEYSLFPLELRLASVALAAMVLLGLGWRLRHKQTVFALILQGARLARSISPCLARSGCGRCCR